MPRYLQSRKVIISLVMFHYCRNTSFKFSLLIRKVCRMNLSTCHNNYKIAHVCTVSLPEYFLQHKYIWITAEYFQLMRQISTRVYQQKGKLDFLHQTTQQVQYRQGMSIQYYWYFHTFKPVLSIGIFNILGIFLKKMYWY